MDTQTRTYESFPVEWDDAGKVLDDSRAAKAIEGMPPCEIADKLESYEKQYQDWKADQHQSTIQIDGLAGSFMRFVAWFFGIPRTLGPAQRVTPGVKVLRSMLADLALAHSKLLVDHKAETINVDTLKQIHTIHGDHRKLRDFLFRHFNDDLARGESVNKPLFEICMEIMLRGQQ